MQADFFLIKEQLIPQMDQHEVLKSLPRQQCIFIRYKLDNPDIGGHQLYWGKDEVPSLRLLVEFFNSIGDQQSTPPAAIAQPTTTVAQVLEPLFFDPEQGFIGQLLAQSSHPQLYTLTPPENPIRLYIDAPQKRFYSTAGLEQLKPFFITPGSRQAQAIQHSQLTADTLADALKPQPLSHLLWYGTFVSSQGKVIKGYQKGDIVQLKRWPDVNLPGCKELIRLAAFMQSNAEDLETIQAKTQFSISQVYDFYNACEVTQLIAHGQVRDSHDKQIDTEQKQLFARIGKRLGQAA